MSEQTPETQEPVPAPERPAEQPPEEEEKSSKLALEIKERMKKGLVQGIKGCGRFRCFYPHCKNYQCEEPPLTTDCALPTNRKALIAHVQGLITSDELVICAPQQNKEARAIQTQDLAEIESDLTAAIPRVTSLFEDFEILAQSFLTEEELPESFLSDGRGLLDLDGLLKLYGFFRSETLEVTAIQLVGRGIQSLANSEVAGLSSPLHLRAAVMLLLCPDIYEPPFRAQLSNLLELVHKFRLNSSAEDKQALVGLLTEVRKREFKEIVDGLQVFLNIELMSHGQRMPIEGMEMLGLLHAANSKLTHLPLSDFYNDSVSNILHHNIKHEYRAWVKKRATGKGMCLLDYPWLINPPQKSLILLIESQYEMSKSIRSDDTFHAFQGMMFPFFYMEIRRDNIVEDALNYLTKAETKNLKKPLKIKFANEQGIDEGGPQKEFFQLLVKQLFTPEYGMFHYFPDSRVFWPNAHSFEPNIKFELIGILLGCAIFNGIILDIRFPGAVYKKLLNVPVDLQDMRQIKPDVVQNLQKLLEYEEDDFEDVFGLNFTVQEDVWGAIETYPLKPKGEEIPVTRENKQEYVQLYTEHFLTKHIERQFKAFATGFQRVIGGEAIWLLHPTELELLVCGSPTFDFKDLERGCKYDGGFNEDDEIITWFWDVFHNNFSDADRKQFLAFSTGSDRAPVGGLGELNFVIGRNGPDSDRLPSAHTCFNYLLLPHYSSKEKLEKLLRLAIENSEGFGLM